MRRGFAAMILLWTVLGSAGIRVVAADVSDLSREGSIQIEMDFGGAVVSGGTMTLYRVGEVRTEDGNYDFVPTGDFLNSGIEFIDIHSGEIALQLANYAANKGLSGRTEEIDRNGQVVFKELLPGLYLLVQNDAPRGYEKVSPFLVSLPQLEDGTYIYEVDASPKVGQIMETEPTVPPSTKPADPTLPQTGQLNWPVAVMAASGLALLASGLLLRHKK